MEVLFQYLLPLVLLPLSFAAMLLFRSSKTRNHPPGTSGWPIIGENINFAVQGSHRFLSDRMKKYSPDVFQTSLMGEKMAIFCGPKGNKFIFTNENKLFASWWPQSIKKAFLSDDQFAQETLKDAPISAQNRKFTQDVLKPEALKDYIPVMDSMARKHIEQEWAPNREVKVFPLSRTYTFKVACKIFMDIEDPSQIKRLFDPFHLMTNGMFSVPIDLPWTAYRGAIKGGKMVRAEILKIVRDRKMTKLETEGGGRDLLSKMLLLKDADGQSFHETEISNSIIRLLVASYDTTSSALTFLLKHLAEFPHVYDKVFQEQTAIAKAKGPDDLLTREDIEKMKYSWNAARESLRVTPAAQGSFREALSDVTFAGFTIPKGWKIFWNVYTTHKDPIYFPEPENFDPTRFDGSGPVPYTFVPFGRGPHMCPGKEYARLEMLVFMHNVVTRFKMEKAIPDEKIAYHASLTPMKGLPVRLQPHEQ